jgi:LCCL domain
VTPSFQSKQERRFIAGCVGLVLATIVLGSGCSKLNNENSNTGGGGHTNTSADNSSAPAPPSSAAPGKPTAWETNATSLNGKEGETLTLTCPPGGAAHTVWGSDIYTSDSSVCTAAVHSGLITFQQGGTVTLELRPGRPVYGTSERNGVTTSNYGAWQSSFVFKTPNNESALRDAEEQTAVMWNTAGTMVGGDDGKTWKFKCPANGREASVWGTDIYTIDSSICNAAVHAGKFTMESGGSVTIELRPGESSYKGSSRNGIKSNDYGAYGRSFVIK